MCEIIFISEQPEAVIGPDGVILYSRSGDQRFARRLARGMWRRFLETEIRRLNEHEAAERAKRKVVEFVKAGH